MQRRDVLKASIHLVNRNTKRRLLLRHRLHHRHLLLTEAKAEAQNPSQNLRLASCQWVKLHGRVEVALFHHRHARHAIVRPATQAQSVCSARFECLLKTRCFSMTRLTLRTTLSSSRRFASSWNTRLQTKSRASKIGDTTLQIVE